MCLIYKGVLALLHKVLPTPSQELRLLVLGIDNAGKSLLVSRLSKEPRRAISPTAGISMEELKIKDLNFRLWDLSGQYNMRQYWRNFYSSANAIIYVVDSSDAPRLTEARSELCEMMLDKRLDRVPLLILANKQDMFNACSSDDVSELLGLSTITGRNWLILECSAVTSSGMQNVLEWIYNTALALR